MNHNFKKDGADPDVDKGEQGRFAWSGGFRFGPALATFLSLFLGTANNQPEDHLRVRHPKGGSGRKHIYPKRRNMVLVSKRVRRKHRRQAA